MPSNARNLANLLGAGESTISVEKLGSDVPPGTEDYSSVDSLGVGTTIGETAFVEGSNRLYIWNGSGWYNIALINTTPTWDSGGQPAGSYVLDADSPQDATVITLAASDPEGLPISYNYITGGSMDSIATISQDSSVFTITPKTIAQAPDGGTGSITFRATDGVNILPQVSSFTLTFITVIENSRYTTLLATATGTSDNNNITDSSTNNHSIAVNGDAHVGTFSPYRSGGYSTYLETQTSRFATNTSSDFDIGGTGDWSYEAWIYADNQTWPSYPRAFGLGPYYNDPKTFGVLLKDPDNSNAITVYWDDAAGQGRKLISTTTFSQGVWHHLATCRSGNNIALFLDGTRIAHNSSYTSAIDAGNTWLYVGHTAINTEGFQGYVRDVRFINGSHPYDASVSSITVPTETLTKTANTKFLSSTLPYLTDISDTGHSLTISGNVSTKPFSLYNYNEYSATDHGGSVYFDGSGDSLTIADDVSIDLSTGDFTLEAWIYLEVTSGNRLIIDRYTSGNNGSYQLYYRDTGNSIAFWTVADGIVAQDPSSYTIKANTWHHVVATRESGTVKIYVDGTQVATGACTTNFDSTLNLGIGAQISTSTNYLTGHISDVRIVKGTAVYTSDFTPPTAPLTAITNTSLLVSGTDASIIDKSQVSNLKLIGNTTGSTTQVKFSNTKSMYFDGSGDYIGISADDIIFSKDYTIEFWMYPTQDANLLMPFSKGTGLQFYHSGGNIAAAMSADNTATYFYNGNFGSITTNAWSHISLVRDSSANTYKFYINGTLEDTLSSSTNISAGEYDWIIGGYLGASYNFEGYIQDFRITKGLARYTANFTPPTASLEG